MKTILDFLTPKSSTLYVNCELTIRQIVETFDVHKFSVVPLIDDEGKFVSTISEGDILRFIKNQCHFDIYMAEDVRINTIELYRPYKTLLITASLDEAIKLTLEQNFIPVVDDRGMYIGIIKRKTIIDYLLNDKN
jgi:CBS domain-containing protein